MTNPVFCSLDTTSVAEASALASRVAAHVGGIKLGLEFFCAQGPQGIREVMAKSGLPLFLDLKLKDIPNTVAGGIRGLLPLQPTWTTIHAMGGTEMMKAAVAEAAEGSAKHGVRRPNILAVTILTSIDQEGLGAIGVPGAVLDQVVRLAESAQAAGCDGIVCSPLEVAAVRAACGPDFKLVIPGIRPAWAAANDQKRFMGPAEAIAAGADVLVIGRPITAADDPAAAAKRIAEELAV